MTHVSIMTLNLSIRFLIKGRRLIYLALPVSGFFIVLFSLENMLELLLSSPSTSRNPS